VRGAGTLPIVRRGPVTAREITDAPIAEKAPTATGKQDIDVQAAILVALRKRDGETVGWRGRSDAVAADGRGIGTIADLAGYQSVPGGNRHPSS
jgi:hypothetical protein